MNMMFTCYNVITIVTIGDENKNIPNIQKITIYCSMVFENFVMGKNTVKIFRLRPYCTDPRKEYKSLLNLLLQLV